MRNALIALPIIGILSACGTSPVSKNSQTDLEYRQQARVATQAISEAPIWMTKLPKEAGVIYDNGTAISSDFSMADLKAKTMAYVKDWAEKKMGRSGGSAPAAVVIPPEVLAYQKVIAALLGSPT